MEPGEEFDYNITAVSGHVGNTGAITRSGASSHIKVKECGSYPTEYENYCKAWQSFPWHVPEPLERYFMNGREVIVIRGVPHRPVSMGSIAADRHGLVRKIIGLLDASSTGARMAAPVEPHRAFLHPVQKRTTDPTCAAIVEDWIETERPDALPHIWQHGDFVINNLGLTDPGLVVFDWEEFGRTAFPGLDLCTLLAFDAAFNADTSWAIVRGARHGKHRYAELPEDGCPVIGLAPELFRQFIQIYPVIFLDLKREYGKSNEMVVNQLVHDLPGQATGKPCAGSRS